MADRTISKKIEYNVTFDRADDTSWWLLIGTRNGRLLNDSLMTVQRIRPKVDLPVGS